MATLNIKNLPDALYRRLKARAKRQHRSVVQEVTHILEEAVNRTESLSIFSLQGLGSGCGQRPTRPTTWSLSGANGVER